MMDPETVERVKRDRKAFEEAGHKAEDILFGRHGVDPAVYLGDMLRLKTEQHIALYVKPTPRWMPDWLYRWLMGHVVLVQDLPTIEVTEEAFNELTGEPVIMRDPRGDPLSTDFHGDRRPLEDIPCQVCGAVRMEHPNMACREWRPA